MTRSYVIDGKSLREEVHGRSSTLIDARPSAAYREGHVPGAVNLDLFNYFVDTSDEGIDRLNQELGQHLGGAGIADGEPVVCYEEALGMRAARMLWLIEYAGHEGAGNDGDRILRGGFSQWLADGGPRCTAPCRRESAPFRVRPRPEILATADYVNQLVSHGRGVVLDVRSQAEHRGETTSSHGPCCPRAGRIPGSRWLEWTEFFTGDLAEVKPTAEIRRLLGERGVTPDEEVVTYCHRGARAAAAYLALKEAGFPRVRNYIGSWHEWAEIPHLPIETG